MKDLEVKLLSSRSKRFWGGCVLAASLTLISCGSSESARTTETLLAARDLSIWIDGHPTHACDDPGVRVIMQPNARVAIRGVDPDDYQLFVDGSLQRVTHTRSVGEAHSEAYADVELAPDALHEIHVAAGNDKVCSTFVRYAAVVAQRLRVETDRQARQRVPLEYSFDPKMGNLASLRGRFVVPELSQANAHSEVAAWLLANAELWDLGRHTSFSLLSSVPSALETDAQVVRLAQHWRGLPIRDAMITVRVRKGEVAFATGRLLPAWALPMNDAPLPRDHTNMWLVSERLSSGRGEIGAVVRRLANGAEPASAPAPSTGDMALIAQAQKLDEASHTVTYDTASGSFSVERSAPTGGPGTVVPPSEWDPQVSQVVAHVEKALSAWDAMLSLDGKPFTKLMLERGSASVRTRVVNGVGDAVTYDSESRGVLLLHKDRKDLAAREPFSKAFATAFFEGLAGQSARREPLTMANNRNPVLEAHGEQMALLTDSTPDWSYGEDSEAEADEAAGYVCAGFVQRAQCVLNLTGLGAGTGALASFVGCNVVTLGTGSVVMVCEGAAVFGLVAGGVAGAVTGVLTCGGKKQDVRVVPFEGPMQISYTEEDYLAVGIPADMAAALGKQGTCQPEAFIQMNDYVNKNCHYDLASAVCIDSAAECANNIKRRQVNEMCLKVRKQRDACFPNPRSGLALTPNELKIFESHAHWSKRLNEMIRKCVSFIKKHKCEETKKATVDCGVGYYSEALPDTGTAVYNLKNLKTGTSAADSITILHSAFARLSAAAVGDSVPNLDATPSLVPAQSSASAAGTVVKLPFFAQLESLPKNPTFASALVSYSDVVKTKMRQLGVLNEDETNPLKRPSCVIALAHRDVGNFGSGSYECDYTRCLPCEETKKKDEDPCLLSPGATCLGGGPGPSGPSSPSNPSNTPSGLSGASCNVVGSRVCESDGKPYVCSAAGQWSPVACRPGQICEAGECRCPTNSAVGPDGNCVSCAAPGAPVCPHDYVMTAESRCVTGKACVDVFGDFTDDSAADNGRGSWSPYTDYRRQEVLPGLWSALPEIGSEAQSVGCCHKSWISGIERETCDRKGEGGAAFINSVLPGFVFGHDVNHLPKRETFTGYLPGRYIEEGSGFGCNHNVTYDLTVSAAGPIHWCGGAKVLDATCPAGTFVCGGACVAAPGCCK